MRLWIDDIRPMPEDFDLLAKTEEEAVCIFEHYIPGAVTHISFDHDLGTGPTGYDIAKYIEEQAAQGFRLFDTWAVHSANPVGRKNIEAAMQNAERLLEEQGL